MIVVRTIAELRQHLAAKSDIGFVPTMGALHEGHLTLVRAARQHKTCVISIFVNPTQFGANEDFDKYPRVEDSDVALAQEASVDFVFLPSVEEMYGESKTVIHVAGVSEKWEGEIRPGHFDGVATVVLKLFNIVQPKVAYFGLKDLQQCAVIQTMVNDLDLNVGLKFIETVREDSGLAMSSRNRRLSEQAVVSASTLNKQLLVAAERLVAGEAKTIVLQQCKDSLSQSGLSVDYVELINPKTMVQVEGPAFPSRLIAAVRIENTRLIDNVPVIV